MKEGKLLKETTMDGGGRVSEVLIDGRRLLDQIEELRKDTEYYKESGNHGEQLCYSCQLEMLEVVRNRVSLMVLEQTMSDETRKKLEDLEAFESDVRARIVDMMDAGELGESLKKHLEDLTALLGKELGERIEAIAVLLENETRKRGGVPR